MKVKDLFESKPSYLTDFKKSAIKMWVPKFKREDYEHVTADDDAIYTNEGMGQQAIIQFKSDGLEITGYEGTKTIPYNEDELKFIRAIEKAAKAVDIRALKNLKALKDNIVLREFKTYKKYDSFFEKANNLLMKHRRDLFKILKDLGLNQLDVKDIKENDTIYILDDVIISLSTASIPIKKIVVTDIVERDADEVIINDDYIVGTYNPAFKTKDEAEIAFIWILFGSTSYVADRSRLKTKSDKTNYVKNMVQFEKFLKKYPKQMKELEKRLK